MSSSAGAIILTNDKKREFAKAAIGIEALIHPQNLTVQEGHRKHWEFRCPNRPGLRLRQSSF
ncbi:hypothetical protein EST38_g14670 [Candolleomyces aberdarensis]|uniref:Uncharacterized protein n=1 Tax=Candolleomyces aberdarensis TaxID=2316362 RepID=A0A4Q2CYJ3_9AGAR|nr:hypothetical protein EST38_g14670 [Candolleomyces aberdarensis]